MEKGILAWVEEPTDWISQMALVEKPNHTLRICIDSEPLNLALKRDYFKLQTLMMFYLTCTKLKSFAKWT